MTEGRLEPRELDAVVAREDAAGMDGAEDSDARLDRSPVLQVLGRPVGALLAVLLVLGSVLGVRSYLVNRPPPLATTVDVSVGASFGDTGFITLLDEGQTVLLSLVLRGPATRTHLQVKEFLGPGLDGTRVDADGERLTVTARTNCPDAVAVPADDVGTVGDADYRLRVSATDDWQREVDAVLAVPAPLGAQLIGTLQRACLGLVVQSVALVGLEPQGANAVVATLASSGPAGIYLLALKPRRGQVPWLPRAPALLPPGAQPVQVTLVAGGTGGCGEGPARLRAPRDIDAWLTTTLGDDTEMLVHALAVPVGSRSVARTMADRPC